MHLRTTANELASWLERAGGVWHVEGEPKLAASLPLPSPASALVEELRRRSCALAVLAPETLTADEDAPVTARELSGAAHLIDGQRVFQLAWVHDDGVVQDSWLLAEQQGPAPGSSDDNAAARSVAAAFRQKPTADR